MTGLEVELIPCRSDNYAVLARTPGGTAFLVDVPEAAPILAVLGARGWRLGVILITHHHADHVDGLAEVVAATGAEVIGPAREAAKIRGLDRTVAGGDTVAIGELAAEVIDTPGHTAGHVSFYLPDAGVAFTGDTLFSLGCGRVFEGTMAEMWGSMLRLRERLAPETRIYCGHEYTLSNARFAVSVDPENADLAHRVAEVEPLRAAGEPTLPAVMSEECAANPFLRADDPALAAAVGHAGADPAEVFAELRRRKDVFR